MIELYLLDRFYVSDSFYHELTTICDGLPKTYLIKQLRKDINVMCHIQRTPGQCEGAEIDVNEALTFAIQSFLSRNSELLEGKDQPSFTVKFCGDGTNITRNTGLCVVSFSLFSKELREKTQGDHCAIAVVKAHEWYDMYKASFANCWRSIDELYEEGTLVVNDKQYNVNVTLGADYKFLLMVLGMSSATSNHACIYCTIHSKDRWDMSKPKHFYSEGEFTRVNIQSGQNTMALGCKHPVLQICHCQPIL